ncbi:MAG: hypothetical protein IIZ59_00475 [Clostridia bacterium]|nr:hypothetical protein [Clostridia bacterium]
MKINFIVAIVFVVISFALLITAIVFNVLENTDASAYFGMGSSLAAFLSCLYGLQSWKE